MNASWQEVLVTSLHRTQIAQYAGASGDFNPVHIDETYAERITGKPVFAHGMLTMGMVGRALTQHYGDTAVQTFGGRFSGQVWPRDALTAAFTERDEDGLVVDVVTTNQDGQVVFSGSARIASEARPAS